MRYDVWGREKNTTEEEEQDAVRRNKNRCSEESEESEESEDSSTDTFDELWWEDVSSTDDIYRPAWKSPNQTY